MTPGRIIRHYSYLDLMALLVIQELRARNVSLQHIRTIVGRLREEGFARPLTEIGYAAVGGNVFLRMPDGQWVDGREPDQRVIAESLDRAPLRAVLRSCVHPS